MTALELITRWLVDLFSPDRYVCRFVRETDEEEE